MSFEEIPEFPYAKGIMPSLSSMFWKIHEDSVSLAANHRGDTINRTMNDYYSADGATDWIFEDIRIRTRTSGYRSQQEVWEEHFDAIGVEDVRAKRDWIYRSTIRCPGGFNPTFGGYLLLKYRPRFMNLKILDPSAGWGDRLIASVASLGAALNCYHGFDPNKTLTPGYNELIRFLNPSAECSVECSPFEDAMVRPGFYDIVITSPPFFDLEEYSSDPSQSNIRYKTYGEWCDRFFTPYLKKCMMSLVEGGVLILYISNFTSHGVVRDIEQQAVSVVGRKYKKEFLSRSLDTRNAKRPAYIFVK